MKLTFEWHEEKAKENLVIHTEREGTTRIVSCRKATTNERRSYEEENFQTSNPKCR